MKLPTIFLFVAIACGTLSAADNKRPNILFVISDDQSWLHTSAAGDPVVKTPAFLDARDPEKPFCFWLGTKEPHRGYGFGNGAKSGMDLDKITVPPFLPDNERVRNDVADYLFEIQWFDQHLDRALKLLEQQGELDNTLIVVTSDNGMPFPRAKATAYNYGVHMPLAIRWGSGIKKPGRIVDDFVNHVDFAPTFLEAAGIEVPKAMSGTSLNNLFQSRESGFIDPQRSFTVTGLERHVISRPDGEMSPRRVINTRDFVYIRNYAPDRWPMGSADFEGSHQGNFSDIDYSPPKSLMLELQDDPEIEPHFKRAFGKLPGEELYRITQDPAQLDNLADNPEYATIKTQLAKQMEERLVDTQDPRAKGLAPWKAYPYYSNGDKYLKGKYPEEYKTLP